MNHNTDQEPRPIQRRTADMPRRGRLRYAKKIALFALLAVFISGVGIAVMSVMNENAVDRLRGGIDSLAFGLFLLRVTLYALIITFYQPLTRWVAARQQWGVDGLQNALGKRNQMALYLLGFELLVSGSFLWRLWS